jgi:hypothetical protein
MPAAGRSRSGFKVKARLGQKEPGHPPVGAENHGRGAPQDQGTKWAYIPKARQGRRPCHTLRRHRSDADPARRDQRSRRPRRACRARPRPGRLAPIGPARRLREIEPPAAATSLGRVQPGREGLAIHPPVLLSKRVFESYDDIVAHCCEAWNKLTDQPWRIMSLGLRHWSYGF